MNNVWSGRGIFWTNAGIENNSQEPPTRRRYLGIENASPFPKRARSPSPELTMRLPITIQM